MVTYMSEEGDPKLWSPICLREEILSYAPICLREEIQNYGHLYV
jgi:hypothetical protein